MKQHLCVTDSPQWLSRWVDAFPHGRVAEDIATVRDVNTDLVWVLWSRSPVDAVREVRQSLPEIPVVVMTPDPSREEAALVLQAGAVGYCHVMAVPALLAQVAEVILMGGVWLGADLMGHLLMTLAPALPPSTEPAPASPLARLTAREREVAQAVAQGQTNKEVARSLGITERTVKAHLGLIFEKLEVRDRLQLLLALKGHR